MTRGAAVGQREAVRDARALQHEVEANQALERARRDQKDVRSADWSRENAALIVVGAADVSDDMVDHEGLAFPYDSFGVHDRMESNDFSCLFLRKKKSNNDSQRHRSSPTHHHH